MRKIYNTLSIIAMECFILAACDNGSNKELLKVVSTEITIPAVGGTKSIAVESSNTFSAYVKDNWLNVSCKGDSVKLKASENDTENPRHTTVTIKSGKDSTIVNVSQEGMTFSLDQSGDIFSHDTGLAYSYKMNSNVPVKLSTNYGWISGRSANDSLYVTVSPNATGKNRYGYLKYTYGNTSDSIKVIQYDTKDFVGDWKIKCSYGIYTYTSKDTTFDVKVTNPIADSLYIAMYNGLLTMHTVLNGYKLKISGADFVGTYDPTDERYKNIPCNEYESGYSTYYVNSCDLDATVGSLFWWHYGFTYTGAYDENKTRTAFTFADDGSCPYFPINGIWFNLFSSESSLGLNTYSNYLIGYLFFMINPVMYRNN